MRSIQGTRHRSVGRAIWPALLGCASLWGLAGCVADRPTPAPRPPVVGRGPVAQLHLLTSPAALDLDQAPGPDGFGVRVYATNPQAAAPVLITQGTLEVLMFDGLLKDTNAPGATPRRVWRFPAGELRRHEQRSSFGVAYVFTLTWGDTPPTQPRITLVARYLPTKGDPIYSGPSSIPVALK